MRRKLDLGTQTIVHIAAFLLALVAAFASTYLGDADKYTVPVLVVLIVAVLDVIVMLTLIYAGEKRERRLWRIQNSIDQQLAKIRSELDVVATDAYGHQDVFLQFLGTMLDELEATAVEAAQRKCIHVVDHHFESIDNVLAAVEQDSERRIRFVWVFEKDEPLFADLNWKRYFNMIADMAQRRKVRVQALLVFSERALESTPRVSRLLECYHGARNMDCQLIDTAVYERLLSESTVDPGCEDFGIYGRSLLFRTECYEPVVRGMFRVREHGRPRMRGLRDLREELTVSNGMLRTGGARNVHER